MAEQIVRLDADDFEEAVDFINFVFSAHEPHDFERLLPKLYRETDEAMARHLAVKRDGSIRAVVGVYPIELRTGEAVFRTAGVGAVSVHPRDRGRGYMRKLMDASIEQMREESYEISWLGGQRQRYGYFGYEICGSVFEFTVSGANVRHSYASPSELTFEKVVSADDERISAIAGWHEHHPIRCSRSADGFLAVATSWYHDLFVALDGDSRAVGYLIADPRSGMVFEAAGESEATTRALVPAWVRHRNNGSVRFEIPPVPSPLADELGRVAEGYRVRPSGNWRIFDWEPVLGALLAWRHRATGLSPGEIIVGIEGYGQLRLAVSAEGTVCERTEAAAAVEMSAAVAMRTLFGPLPPWASGAITGSVLDGWCPLPLFMPRQDGV